MRKLFLFLSCFFTFVSMLQAQVAVGEWRMHFSYNTTTKVVLSDTKAYAVADNKLFSVDKDNFSIESYSKLSGLSENDVSMLAYDNVSKLLVVVYTNSNIDLIDEKGNIYNVADLYRKNMTVSKKVNHISFYQGSAYFACDFGIMVLNLTKKEIADTYIIGDNATMIPVYGVNVKDAYLYALTDEGIQKAPLQGVNLLNYENWRERIAMPDESALFRDMDAFNGDFYVAKQNEHVYVLQNGVWSVFYFNETRTPISIETIGGSFMINNATKITRFNSNLTSEIVADREVAESWYDESEGVYWIASNTQGLLRTIVGEGSFSYKPSSPYVSTAQKFYYNDGRILSAPGKSWDDRYGLSGAVLLFENEDWTVYTAESSGVYTFSNVFLDIVSLAIDPLDRNKVYASTWGEGVFVFENGIATQLFNGLNTNAVLETAVPNDHHYYRIDGLAFDKQKNLWMLNSHANGAVKVMTHQGEWYSLVYPTLANQPLLRDLMMHSRGQKWIISSTGSGRGIFVIDDNGTIVNTADDVTRFFNLFTDKDGNAISPSYYYSIAEDKDGTVWIGTDKGPLLMTNVSKVFDTNYTCTRVKIPRNDGTLLADFLLDNEEIRAIAVDAANRKWIGTGNSGIYLVSANGRETIHHFTVDNSPLSSNRIESICIHEDTGEVFFSTQDGIVSYRSDATKEAKTLNQIEVFPNPVHLHYTGLITIRGLVADTEVNIVTQSGQLVFTGTATGGSIVWNGNNANNTPLATGVYYVFCVNADGTDSGSSKFLVIR